MVHNYQIIKLLLLQQIPVKRATYLLALVNVTQYHATMRWIKMSFHCQGQI